MFYVAVSDYGWEGFIWRQDQNCTTFQIRQAFPFTSFEDADLCAKRLGFRCYAILQA